MSKQKASSFDTRRAAPKRPARAARPTGQPCTTAATSAVSRGRRSAPSPRRSGGGHSRPRTWNAASSSYRALGRSVRSQWSSSRVPRPARPNVLTRQGTIYKPSVLRDYRADLETRVLPDLGARRISDIRPMPSDADRRGQRPSREPGGLAIRLRHVDERELSVRISLAIDMNCSELNLDKYQRAKLLRGWGTIPTSTTSCGPHLPPMWADRSADTRRGSQGSAPRDRSRGHLVAASVAKKLEPRPATEQFTTTRPSRLSRHYKVGRRDKVVPLTSLPQSDTQAPRPLVVASDNVLRIAYISPGNGQDGDVMVTVTFNLPHAHMVGPPTTKRSADIRSPAVASSPTAHSNRALLLDPSAQADELGSLPLQPRALRVAASLRLQLPRHHLRVRGAWLRL